MLTYLLHQRVFRAEDNKELQFPNELKVIVKLAPPTVFGMANDYSRLVVHGSKTHMLWNSNSGRLQWKSEPSLSPLEVQVESPTTKFLLQGDLLTYTCPCENLDQLIGCLNGLQFVLPAFLNIKFPDPPVVEYIKGALGSVDFRWEHGGMVQSCTPQSGEILEEHVAEFLKTLPLFTGTKNRRLVTAIHYFYTGSRLLVSGHSQWEFMAECILNLCKALGILFGNDMDSVRAGLARLGYAAEEIEGDFIPLIILRNSVDVAHPRVAIFPQEHLSILYVYLSNSETRFRELLERTIQSVGSEEFELPQDEDLRLDPTERLKLDRLMENLKKRNPGTDTEQGEANKPN